MGAAARLVPLTRLTTFAHSRIAAEIPVAMSGRNIRVLIAARETLFSGTGRKQCTAALSLRLGYLSPRRWRCVPLEFNQQRYEVAGIASFLSDREVKKRLKKDLIVHPLIHTKSQAIGAKLDLRLDGVFYEVEQRAISAFDPLSPPTHDYRREVVIPVGQSYTLHPGSLVLAPTYENLSMPNDLLGFLQGRSSLGRLGVIVHATAGLVDPGYRGSLTLELSNLGHLPVKLYPLQRIGSLAFAEVKGEVEFPVGKPIPVPLGFEEAKYDAPVSLASRLQQDWETRVLREIQAELQGRNAVGVKS